MSNLLHNHSMSRFAPVALALLMFTALAAPAAQKPASQTPAEAEVRLGKEVHHVLVTEPFYTLFDILGYKVEGTTVTLTGQVTRYALRIDAVNDVKAIKGVGKVIDKIEVLPVSQMDNHLRLRLFRAIYSAPNLRTYAIEALPSIHIIVRYGHVTLIGSVLDQADKNIAYMRAMGVSGAFSVKNELKVEHRSK